MNQLLIIEQNLRITDALIKGIANFVLDSEHSNVEEYMEKLLLETKTENSNTIATLEFAHVDLAFSKSLQLKMKATVKINLKSHPFNELNTIDAVVHATNIRKLFFKKFFNDLKLIDDDIDRIISGTERKITTIKELHVLKRDDKIAKHEAIVEKLNMFKTKETENALKLSELLLNKSKSEPSVEDLEEFANTMVNMRKCDTGSKIFIKAPKDDEENNFKVKSIEPIDVKEIYVSNQVCPNNQIRLFIIDTSGGLHNCFISGIGNFEEFFEGIQSKEYIFVKSYGKVVLTHKDLATEMIENKNQLNLRGMYILSKETLKHAQSVWDFNQTLFPD